MPTKKQTNPGSAMATVVGGALSLVALAASIFSENDVFTCLLRGGAAFLGGYFVTQIWYLLTSQSVVEADEAEETPAPEAAQPTVIEPSDAPTEAETPAMEPEPELEAA